MEKGTYCLDWGVQQVWIIERQTRTASMMTKENRESIWVHPDGDLVAEDTKISLPEIFAEVDKMIA